MGSSSEMLGITGINIQSHTVSECHTALPVETTDLGNQLVNMLVCMGKAMGALPHAGEVKLGLELCQPVFEVNGRWFCRGEENLVQGHSTDLLVCVCVTCHRVQRTVSLAGFIFNYF